MIMFNGMPSGQIYSLVPNCLSLLIDATRDHPSIKDMNININEIFISAPSKLHNVRDEILASKHVAILEL